MAACIQSIPCTFAPSTLPTADSPPSYWLKSEFPCPHSTEGSNVPLPQDADIVVLGSGITGVSFVYELIKALKERGGIDDLKVRGEVLKVVILEAREFCSGATGRNGGHFTSSGLFYFQTRTLMHSLAAAHAGVDLENYSVQKVLTFLDANDLRQQVDFVNGGKYIVFKTKEEADQTREQLEAARKAGRKEVEEIVWLNPEQVQSEIGTSSGIVHSAIYVSDANNLFPRKLVSELYTSALSTSNTLPYVSVSLHTLTPCTSINSSFHSTSYDLLTPRGTIAAPIIIHATNAYISHLLPHLATTPSHPHAVIPARGQCIAVSPPPSSTTHSVWRSSISAEHGSEYIFQRPFTPPSSKNLGSGEIILGGGRQVSSSFEYGISDDSYTNDKISAYLRQFLKGWFGRIWKSEDEANVDVDVKEEWTGVMGFSRTEDPWVGKIYDADGREVKGQYMSTGYTGHGMTRAPGCAEALARMVIADLANEKWEVPYWFPDHLITRPPKDRRKIRLFG